MSAGTTGRLLSGAILAGGRASRLGGVAKGLELVGSERIVDRVAAALRACTADIVIVGAAGDAAATLPGVHPVADDTPGSGPLGGIVSALRATQRDTLVVAWDMPFVTEATLQPLLDAPADADLSVPVWGDRLEPLCALYRLSALPMLAASFAAGERSARAALRQLRVHRVEYAMDGMSPPSFASINTPEQLAAARGGERVFTSRRNHQ